MRALSDDHSEEGMLILRQGFWPRQTSAGNTRYITGNSCFPGSGGARGEHSTVRGVLVTQAWTGTTGCAQEKARACTARGGATGYEWGSTGGHTRNEGTGNAARVRVQ